MNKLGVAATTALAAGSLLLSGCGSGSGDSGGSDDSGLTVVAAAYPFAQVVQKVAGDAVTVIDLTNPGAEPHDLELKPKQVAAVQNADLLVYSHGFQPAVDNAAQLADLPDANLIDVTKVAEVIDRQHSQDHEDTDDESDAEIDPHTWLNPQNQIRLANAVANKLSALDHANAATYKSNAAKVTKELATLDHEFEAGLQHCQTRTIVTSHAAFAYLADRYDLDQVAIAGINPHNGPSPAALADITGLVRKQNVTTIFTEALVSPATARTVAEETGAKLATLYPIEGLSDKTADEDYVSLMHKNLGAIVKANGCT